MAFALQCHAMPRKLPKCLELCFTFILTDFFQALDLSWYQLAKLQIWLWLLLDEIEALTPSIASVMNGGRSEVRDGSFIMASLMGKRHGPPTRNATLPNSPLLHLGALLRVQLLFYLVRHLLDEPERFPNLSVVGVTPLAMEHGPVLEVRVSASFPGSFLCPVQEAVGARLIQAFEQGRVMVHIPAFCPDQFTHPKAYTGCLRLFLPVATSALGLSFQDAVAIQPSGLLPNALERLQARTATGSGFDLRKICSLMLTGPRDLGFYYPMRFHKLGTYELRGRHAALFAAHLRAIDNLSPRTASRLVHLYSTSLGATASGVPCERRFSARPRGRPLLHFSGTLCQ